MMYCYWCITPTRAGRKSFLDRVQHGVWNSAKMSHIYWEGDLKSCLLKEIGISKTFAVKKSAKIE